MNETSPHDAGERAEPTVPNRPNLLHWGAGLVVLILAIWAALAVHETYLSDSGLQAPRRLPERHRPFWTPGGGHL